MAWSPTFNAIGWLIAATALLAVPAHWVKRSGPVLTIAAAVLMTADLAANNGPNESTARASTGYDILKPDCRNETIRFLKAKARRAPGTEWRDRVELVGLGFEWPNAALVHGLDHTLGYNPLRIGLVARTLGARDYIAGPDQRAFTPLFPSYHSTLANLLGLRLIASSIPIEQIDLQLARGELKFLARTQDAYIYENVDALPRVMFVREWEHANFEDIIETGRWPEFDPTATVLLDGEPEIAGAPEELSHPTELGRAHPPLREHHRRDRGGSGNRGIHRAQRRLASLVDSRGRWPINGHPPCQRDVPRGARAGWQASRALRVHAVLRSHCRAR